jgi:hypothetical protein
MIAPLVFSFWFRRSGVARTGRAWSQRAEQRKARSLGRWARRDGSTSSQKACSEKSGRSAGSSSMITISDTGVPLTIYLHLSVSVSLSMATFICIWHNHSRTRTCTHTQTHTHTHTHTHKHSHIPESEARRVFHLDNVFDVSPAAERAFTFQV